MALFVNVLVMAIMAAGIFARGIGTLPDAARPFVASGAVLVTFLGLIQVLCNQFGFDRDGFRALVLLPARRPLLLLGKNLSLLPPALIVFLVFLGLVTVLAHLPVWAILAACLQFSAAFLGLSLLGNFVSILAPYRIAAGSLKPTKMKATNMLVIVFIQMLFPLAAIPIMAPAGLGLLCEYFGWLPAGRVTLLCSALLVVLTGLLYWQTLAPLGALLQRREMRILNVVTQEVE